REGMWWLNLGGAKACLPTENSIMTPSESIQATWRHPDMSRSLLAEKPIKPPKELKKFFDDPPLVGDERREDYENLFATLAMTVKPADAIEWMYLGDVVNLTWEIRRMRRIKAGMINSSLEKSRTHRLRTAAYLEELSEDEELT